MKTIKYILFGIAILTQFSINGQVISENVEEDIIGTWIPEIDGVDYKWVFNESQLIEYAEGKVWHVYNYTITKEPSMDGTLTFNELELININDPDDIYTYTANIVDGNRLYLVYDLQPGKSIDFTRQ